MNSYAPLMNEEEIQKRRKWQDEVYDKLKSIDKIREVEVLGKKLTILPNMFAPLWGDSLLLAKNVLKEVKETDSVLDLGTGTGIQGIFAAPKAKKVTCVDINSEAVKCAKLNAKKNNLTDKMNIFESNLFSNIKDKFDLIIFNPPFRWFKPRDILERGELDENYQTLVKFFREVRNYLTENARILLVFSDSGDIKYLEELINKNKFNYEIIDKEKLNNWLYVVYRIY
jgi:release factor glutamine methyltransferase